MQETSQGVNNSRIRSLLGDESYEEFSYGCWVRIAKWYGGKWCERPVCFEEYSAVVWLIEDPEGLDILEVVPVIVGANPRSIDRARNYCRLLPHPEEDNHGKEHEGKRHDGVVGNDRIGRQDDEEEGKPSGTSDTSGE